MLERSTRKLMRRTGKKLVDKLPSEMKDVRIKFVGVPWFCTSAR